GARIWVDANRPVVEIEIVTAPATSVEAALEMWRTTPYAVKTQTGDLFKNLSWPDPHPTVVSPDRVMNDERERIVWCHHNEKRDVDGFAINMKLQGLGEQAERMQHPLLGRTFGGAIEGDGFVKVDSLRLKSSTTRRKHRLSIYALTAHPATIEQWREKLGQ